MSKIFISKTNSEYRENIIDNILISDEEAIEMIKKFGLYNFLNKYKISNKFILENKDILDKSIIIRSVTLSEGIINKLLKCKYLENKDIFELNMNTYSKLSDKFIKKYKNSINWKRMLLYLINSEKDFNVEELYDIIEENNCWDIISTYDKLSKDFIRKYSDKLNWEMISAIILFTEDEMVEFSDKIKTSLVKIMSL